MKRCKAVNVMCMAGILAILACMWLHANPPHSPDRYASAHPQSTMIPLRGFAADSLINTGDAKALDALPGIGEVISQRIIDMREGMSGFLLPEDLLLVKGIGEKTLDNIMNAYPDQLIVLKEILD